MEYNPEIEENLDDRLFQLHLHAQNMMREDHEIQEVLTKKHTCIDFRYKKIQTSNHLSTFSKDFRSIGANREDRLFYGPLIDQGSCTLEANYSEEYQKNIRRLTSKQHSKIKSGNLGNGQTTRHRKFQSESVRSAYDGTFINQRNKNFNKKLVNCYRSLQEQ